MGVLGNQFKPADVIIDKFDGDGSTLAFNVTRDLGTDNAYQVFVNGMHQTIGDQVTRAGLVFTFTLAPPTGTDNVVIRAVGEPQDIGTPSSGAVDTAQLADNGVTNDKVLNGTLDSMKLNAASLKLFPKAWINMNGTGTIAIRDSANIASITDIGTGQYEVNFTDAFASVNYCPVASVSASSVTTAAQIKIQPNTVSQMLVSTEASSTGTETDYDYICIAVFGDLA